MSPDVLLPSAAAIEVEDGELMYLELQVTPTLASVTAIGLRLLPVLLTPLLLSSPVVPRILVGVSIRCLLCRLLVPVLIVSVRVLLAVVAPTVVNDVLPKNKLWVGGVNAKGCTRYRHLVWLAARVF